MLTAWHPPPGACIGPSHVVVAACACCFVVNINAQYQSALLQSLAGQLIRQSMQGAVATRQLPSMQTTSNLRFKCLSFG